MFCDKSELQIGNRKRLHTIKENELYYRLGFILGMEWGVRREIFWLKVSDIFLVSTLFVGVNVFSYESFFNIDNGDYIYVCIYWRNYQLDYGIKIDQFKKI